MRVTEKGIHMVKQYIPIGMYNRNTQIFEWCGYKHIFEEIYNNVASDTLFMNYKKISNKFFEPLIKINEQLHYAIPYYATILYGRFKLIPIDIAKTNKILYILIDLDIPNKLSIEEFVNVTTPYKLLGDLMDAIESHS